MSWFKGVETGEKLEEVGDDVRAIEVVHAEPVVAVVVEDDK